jgi:EmrB/QacA subfamily drug resistance transporter
VICSNSAAAPAVARDPRRWLTLIAMTGSLSMVLLDETIVGVALPTIQRDLDLSPGGLQWVVNAYLLVFAVLVAVGGRLADMFNRVHVFLAGAAVFVAASASAGMAASELWLLAGRAAQGAGAALMVPPTTAIVVNAFRVDERGRAMGLYAGVSMIFLSLGPLVGGFLSDYLTWRCVFFVNLPVGLLTVLLTLHARPEGRVGGGQHMDWVGAALLVPGLSAIVLALMESNAWGWDAPQTVVLLLGGAALLAAFVLGQLRVAQPLLELRLFPGRNFSADAVVLFCAQFALLGLSVFGAIYIQNVLGFSPVGAGLALLPLTLPLLAVSPVAGRLYDRLGPRGVVTGGCVLLGGAYLYSALIVGHRDYLLALPGLLASGAGIGLAMSPSSTDALNAATRDLRGQASGAIQTVRQVGGTIGLAIAGTVVAGVFQSSLESGLAHSGATHAKIAVVERILAEDPATQARAAASAHPDKVAQITAIAKDAITDAIASSYAVGAGVMLLAAIVAWRRLRKVAYDDDEPVGAAAAAVAKGSNLRPTP